MKLNLIFSSFLLLSKSGPEVPFLYSLFSCGSGLWKEKKLEEKEVVGAAVHAVNGLWPPLCGRSRPTTSPLRGTTGKWTTHTKDKDKRNLFVVHLPWFSALAVFFLLTDCPHTSGQRCTCVLGQSEKKKGKCGMVGDHSLRGRISQDSGFSGKETLIRLTFLCVQILN